MKKNAEIYVTLKGLVPTPREQAFIEWRDFRKEAFHKKFEEGISRKEQKAIDKKLDDLWRRVGSIPYTVSSLGAIPSRITPDSARARLLVAMLKHPGLTYDKYIKMTGYAGHQSEFRTCLKFFGYTEIVGGRITLTAAGKALARVLEDRGTKIQD